MQRPETDNTRSARTVVLREVMDWRAATIAGLVAGIISLLIVMLWYMVKFGGSPWVVPHFIAAILLGRDALATVTTFNPAVILVGIGVHLLACVLFALLIAFVFHRWGMIVSFLGGALLGAALFGINFFALTSVFPWLSAGRMGAILLAHMLFGGLTGALYELLEQDRIVTVEDSAPDDYMEPLQRERTLP